jgi:uncharacterized protein YbaP (TraB family)
MNTAIRVFLALLSIGFLVYCRQKKEFATAASNKSLLWEVSGNGLPQPSYFLGTMHLMCADEAVLSENTKAIIKLVKQIYLEVDMDNMSELLNGMQFMSMKGEITLKDVLPENDYEKVKAFFELNQPVIPFTELEKQQPMMLASSLYDLFLACEKKAGIDIRVIEEAMKYKTETKGLESMSFQTSIIDSIPYEEQAKELVSTIDNLEKYKASLDELIKAYKQQDIDQLHELSTKEEAGIGNYLDLLLYDRNKRWADQFQNIAQQKSTLFAVGAGHLGGDKGVINLLKKKGYTVRAIVN